MRLWEKIILVVGMTALAVFILVVLFIWWAFTSEDKSLFTRIEYGNPPVIYFVKQQRFFEGLAGYGLYREEDGERVHIGTTNKLFNTNESGEINWPTDPETVVTFFDDREGENTNRDQEIFYYKPVTKEFIPIDSWQELVNEQNGYTLQYPSSFVLYQDISKNMPKATGELLVSIHGNGQRNQMLSLYDTTLVHLNSNKTLIDAVVFVLATTQENWDEIDSLKSVPLHSHVQWKEEQEFLDKSKVGDTCDFVYKKYTEDGDNFCRIISFNDQIAFDRQIFWSPSASAVRVITFYKNDTRYDIGIPLPSNGFTDFKALDTLLTYHALPQLGYSIADSIRVK